MANCNVKEAHADVNVVVDEMKKKKRKDKTDKEAAEDKIFSDCEKSVLENNNDWQLMTAHVFFAAHASL